MLVTITKNKGRRVAVMLIELCFYFPSRHAPRNDVIDLIALAPLHYLPIKAVFISVFHLKYLPTITRQSTAAGFILSLPISCQMSYAGVNVKFPYISRT